ncbi:MAG: hypothetical protein AAGF56_15360, partial [Pseudomonadota bacterium]
TTPLTEDFGYEAWQEANPEAIPLAIRNESGELRILSTTSSINNTSDARIIWLGHARDEVIHKK